MMRTFLSLLIALGLVFNFSLVMAVPALALSEVCVDDNFDSSTPSWGTTHFDSIQTSANVKQLIHDFVAASGESVTAGDVVAFVDGYAQNGLFPSLNFITYGSEYVFNSHATTYTSAAAFSSSKFVVTYSDWGNSNYGTAVIGDVSGNTISYGSGYVFNSANTQYISAAALSPTTFVVTYRDSGNSGYGTAVIGGVLGNTIIYGKEYVFNSHATTYISAVALSSTRFVVTYRDDGNSNYGTAVIGDVSGQNITYGSEYVFNAATTLWNSAAALSSSQFVVAYSDDDDLGYGTAVIGDVSGNTISYGSEYVFNSGIPWYTSAAALSSTRFVVTYSDVDNAVYGTAVIGDVSGNTISYGSEYVFNSDTTYNISAAALSSTRFEVAYSDVGNSDYGTAVIGDVFGNTISYGSEYVFNSDSNQYISAAALSSTRFVVTYQDVGNFSYGTAVIGDAPVATTLELEPAVDSNPVDTNHILTATVRDQFNERMPDVTVSWSIESGPGGFVGTPETTTDINGEAQATITSDTPGTTIVKASVSETVYDTASKTWTYTPVATTLELEPAVDSNPVDTNHILTATVRDQFNERMPDVTVSWSIESGPGNFVGTPETTTDINGEAQATITSDTPGTTIVKASVSETVYDTASKTWTYTPVATTLELEPAVDSNPVDTNHILTATVRDQFNDRMPDVTVSWSIESGPGNFVGTPETTTDINGEAQATITSDTPGTTIVKANVSETVYDTASKTWTDEGPPSALDLIEGVNTIAYTGATTSLPEALTNIGPDGLDVVDGLWARGAWTGREWLYYNARIPFGTLSQLETFRGYIVVVKEDCTWELSQ